MVAKERVRVVLVGLGVACTHESTTSVAAAVASCSAASNSANIEYPGVASFAGNAGRRRGGVSAAMVSPRWISGAPKSRGTAGLPDADWARVARGS